MKYNIGRNETCDMVLKDPSNRTSRSHATLRIAGRKVTIIDHSSNGTFVEGLRLVPGREYPIKRGAKVSFAKACNLDWSKVPEHSKDETYAKMKILAFSLIVILIAAGAYYFCYYREQERALELSEQRETILLEQKEQAEQQASRLKEEQQMRLDSINEAKIKAEAKRAQMEREQELKAERARQAKAIEEAKRQKESKQQYF